MGVYSYRVHCQMQGYKARQNRMFAMVSFASDKQSAVQKGQHLSFRQPYGEETKAPPRNPPPWKGFEGSFSKRMRFMAVLKWS